MNTWTEFNPTTEPLLAYSGEYPRHLYRYRSISPSTIDRIINFELLEEGIFLAGLCDLNDPDEGRFLLRFNGTRDEIASYWLSAFESATPHIAEYDRKKLSYERADEVIAAGRRPPAHVVEYMRHNLENLCRVACFTTLPTNYSMWANYSKYFQGATKAYDHAGICIEYRCDEGWHSLNLGPVTYSDDVPVINILNNNEKEMVRSMYLKSSEWQGEKEWRIFMLLQSTPPFPENLTTNSRVRVEGSVSGVIFGLNTPDSIVQQISDRLRLAGRDLLLRRVVRDPMTYERVLREIP